MHFWIAEWRSSLPPTMWGPSWSSPRTGGGDFKDMTYLTETRTTLVYDMPLAEV